MSVGVVEQTVVVGVYDGSVYALVGIGFTVVWSLTRTLALAHGDVVVGATLLGVLAVVGRTPVAGDLGVAASVGLVLLALAVGAALSAASYAVAVRPFLTAPAAAGRGGRPRAEDVLGWVAATLAVGLVVRASVSLALPAAGYAVPDPLHLSGLTRSGVLRLPDGAGLPVRDVGVAAVAVVLAVLVDRLVVSSRAGRAVRAVAADRDAAALCGVDVSRVVLAAFVGVGVLAAAAGLLLAPGRTVTVDDGVLLGLTGAAAAVVGGLGSSRGAVLGGLSVGLVQQAVVAVPALGAAWFDVVPLGLLVAVLVLRPAPRATT